MPSLALQSRSSASHMGMQGAKACQPLPNYLVAASRSQTTMQTQCRVGRAAAIILSIPGLGVLCKQTVATNGQGSTSEGSTSMLRHEVPVATCPDPWGS